MKYCKHIQTHCQSYVNLLVVLIMQSTCMYACNTYTAHQLFIWGWCETIVLKRNYQGNHDCSVPCKHNFLPMRCKQEHITEVMCSWCKQEFIELLVHGWGAVPFASNDKPRFSCFCNACMRVKGGCFMLKTCEGYA